MSRPSGRTNQVESSGIVMNVHETCLCDTRGGGKRGTPLRAAKNARGTCRDIKAGRGRCPPILDSRLGADVWLRVEK